ncbi:MAG: hypothetical protein KatS3mg050_2287 [Litorilinea sp.]|nr:MAG: hypothetical protein KatS3mg050_2287 [Litorilinea sp.]
MGTSKRLEAQAEALMTPTLARPGGMIGILLLLAGLLFGTPATTAVAAPATPPPQQEPNRLIVKFRPGADGPTIGQSPGVVERVEPLAGVGAQLVQTAPGRLEEVYASLANDPDVLYVYPDYVIQPAGLPNDPDFSQAQWGPQQIQAPAAWDYSTGEGVVIAVVDSGVDPGHPDLRDRLLPGYNIYDDNTDTSDRCGHGTHVAGIAAATANNGIGIAGIAPNAQILPVKVLNDVCMGSYSRLIRGIIYAVDHGARIIVITSGGTGESPPLQDALVYARNQGALVVAAAGNYNTDEPFYPGSYPEALTVAGTAQEDSRYGYSNFGQQIDLSAPAVNIYSTFWRSNSGSTYSYLTGTSMAAPHVAGVAALVWALNPALSAEAVEAILTQNADDLGPTGWDVYYGHGRVNALRAVQATSPRPLHVADLQGTVTAGSDQWSAQVAVTVHDALGYPVRDVAVNAEWSAGTIATSQCRTDGQGQCTVTSGALPGDLYQVTLTVTGLRSPDGFQENNREATLRDNPGEDRLTLASPFPNPATLLHVGGLQIRYQKHYTHWAATARVTVYDGTETPVADVTVEAQWQGDDIQTSSCVTDSQGQCTLQSAAYPWDAAPLELTVTDLRRDGYQFDPGAAHDLTATSGLMPAVTRLQAYDAVPQEDGVIIHWRVVQPADVVDFHAYRSHSAQFDAAQPVPVALLATDAAGESLYSMVDQTVEPGDTYYYWLVEIGEQGEGAAIGPVAVNVPGYAIFLPVVRR